MRNRNIWLVRHSETLPCDGDSPRLMRMGLLAEELRKGSNNITWWTSTLHYSNKTMRYKSDAELAVDDNYRIRFVHSIGYDKNLSIRRLRHYALEQKRFLQLAEREESIPDIIVTSMPAIEWAYASVKYAKAHNVPVFVDIRDTFPDMYLDYFPDKLKSLGNVAIAPYRRQLAWTLSNATGIIASSDGFLDWALNYADRKRIETDRVYHISYPDISGSYTHTERNKWCEMGLSTDDFIACFFGQFGHTVDIDTVVAAGKMFPVDSRVKFVICGVGEKRDVYLEDCKNHPNILFPGWVNGKEIAALCAISSVGLMAYRPSKNYEWSMPNKFGEYLALSQAILLQPNGLMVNYINNRYCGISYSNAVELKAAIDYLADNPGVLADMKNNARQLYLDEFCAEKVYREEADYLEAYTDRTRRL